MFEALLDVERAVDSVGTLDTASALGVIGVEGTVNKLYAQFCLRRTNAVTALAVVRFCA